MPIILSILLMQIFTLTLGYLTLLAELYHYALSSLLFLENYWLTTCTPKLKSHKSSSQTLQSSVI